MQSQSKKRERTEEGAPIEQGFSGMKAWIQKNNDYVLGELTALQETTPVI